MRTTWVDLPKLEPSDSGGLEGSWENVAVFHGRGGKAAAVEWLREMFGGEVVDEEGRLSLLSYGQREDLDE